MFRYAGTQIPRPEDPRWVERGVKPFQSSQGGNDIVNTTKIERLGSTSVTIPANTNSAFVNQAITPAVPDVIANYKIFSGIDDPTQTTVWVMGARLTTTSNLAVRIGRVIPLAVLSGTTGATVAGNPLSDVSGMGLTPIPNPTTVLDAHGTNAFFNHAHDTVGHPVTDPGHIHSLSQIQPALTASVDWMIIHI